MASRNAVSPLRANYLQIALLGSTAKSHPPRRRDPHTLRTSRRRPPHQLARSATAACRRPRRAATQRSLSPVSTRGAWRTPRGTATRPEPSLDQQLKSGPWVLTGDAARVRPCQSRRFGSNLASQSARRVDVGLVVRAAEKATSAGAKLGRKNAHMPFAGTVVGQPGHRKYAKARS